MSRLWRREKTAVLAKKDRMRVTLYTATVKLNLEHATKAQRGSRVIALLFP
jgi:hypothetical protein